MDTTEHPSFGALLRGYRHAAGLTQEELTERAELSVRQLAYLERNQRVPRPGTIRRLGEALGLSSEDHALLLAAVQEETPAQAVRVRAQISLPLTPTPFIGREREVDTVADLVRQEHVRLLTLTGPGGTGKTRLAIEVARRLLEPFPDGVVFVPLGALADPALVGATLAAALEVKKTPDQSIIEALTADLREKQLLLLLDNFEHLLNAASIVSDLLAACPQLRVLVTSRALLHLAAEHNYAVSPLGFPDAGARVSLETLVQYDAVALFVERARAVKAGFFLTEENAPVAVEICRQLDGLPLAIELAAARLRLFPPHALLGRLDTRLRLLNGPEQRLFARMSVFSGGCTLEAAETVCTADSELSTDVLEGMASLVEQSLVFQDGAQEPRFGMLETIREYAQEQLAHQEGAKSFRDRHARYYRFLAERGDQPSADHAVTLQLLETEHANLRKALQWLCDRADFEAAYALATSLFSLWLDHSHYDEARTWFDRLLSHEDEVSAGALSKLLLGANWFLEPREGAATRLEQAYRLCCELDDMTGAATALIRLADIVGATDNSKATCLAEQGLGIMRTIGDRVGYGHRPSGAQSACHATPRVPALTRMPRRSTVPLPPGRTCGDDRMDALSLDMDRAL